MSINVKINSNLQNTIVAKINNSSGFLQTTHSINIKNHRHEYQLNIKL